MKRGSALLMALWIILTLSVIVMSFAFEAKLQGGVNLYVQNKNRVKRLIDAGRVIGEVVMLGYNDAKQRSVDEDEKELFDDDRWFRAKRDLKYGTGCTVGPILLDEEDPDSGVVTVEITLDSVDSSDGSGLNINNYYDGGDSNWKDILKQVLIECGVPTDETFRDEEGKSIDLMNHVLACWNDYRDDNDDRLDITGGKGEGHGAEKKEYEEYYDDHRKDFAEEDRFEPANGEISDLKELSRVLCFREFPALLTGGVVNPWEKSEKAQIRSSGIMNSGLLSVSGDGKLNVNTCTERQLMVILSVFDSDVISDDDYENVREIAKAIVACRSIAPEDYDVPPGLDRYGYGEFEGSPDWWEDMCRRVNDEFDLEVPNEVKEYLTAQPTETAMFKMKITAALMDMEYTAECECYVKDKKVRYTSWKE